MSYGLYGKSKPMHSFKLEGSSSGVFFLWKTTTRTVTKRTDMNRNTATVKLAHRMISLRP